MLKKKSSSSQKKRKHLHSEERPDGRKRRSLDSRTEESKDELADAELDRVGSDIEEGGLNLNLPFQPITAYVSDKKEMLEQCFRVLGEKKLRKMLPDEFKECSLEEIKSLCWEQLDPISEKNIIQILAGDELTGGSGSANALESQQDNNVDSTSCLKEMAKAEDPKQEGGGSGEESDVLSINADTYDSDIEGPKEEQSVQPVEVKVKVGDGGGEGSHPAVKPHTTEPKKDIQNDIEKSVNEILALAPSKDEAKDKSGPPQSSDVGLQDQGAPPASGSLLAGSPPAGSPPASGSPPAGSPPAGSPPAGPPPAGPSVKQLELLELEMRARAIKALMKAGDVKKLCIAKNI